MKLTDLYKLERTNTLDLSKPFIVRLSAVGYAGYVNGYSYEETTQMYHYYLNSCRFLMEHYFNTSCKFMWVTPKKLLMYFKDANSYGLNEGNTFRSDKLTGINCSILAAHFNKTYKNLVNSNKIMLWNGYAYNMDSENIINYLVAKQKNHVICEGGRGLQDIFYRRDESYDVVGLNAPNFKNSNELKYFI